LVSAPKDLLREVIELPLYAIDGEKLIKQTPSSFGDLGILERADLQRLLRQQADVLGEDLMIIAEEFGSWEDSKRRIDLLALDRSARLVVIELKRTSDGGHMELQAIRYAAMVSAMTFDEVVAAYTNYRELHMPGSAADARTELADFLGLDPADEIAIESDIRIILVSADFGREITTAVLWLNSFDRMDIRCTRLIPYKLDSTVYVDVQQLIPLPEAADYQVRLRKKENAQARSQSGTDGRDLTRYHIVVGGQTLPAQNKRNAVRTMIMELHKAGVSCQAIASALPSHKFRVIPGLLTSPDEIRASFHEQYPNANPKRWFCDSPVLDEQSGKTYLVTKM
jgi:hypothetical protein